MKVNQYISLGIHLIQQRAVAVVMWMTMEPLNRVGVELDECLKLLVIHIILTPDQKHLRYNVVTK